MYTFIGSRSAAIQFWTKGVKKCEFQFRLEFQYTLTQSKPVEIHFSAFQARDELLYVHLKRESLQEFISQLHQANAVLAFFSADSILLTASIA